MDHRLCPHPNCVYVINPSDQQSDAQKRLKSVFLVFQDLLRRLREPLQVREHDPEETRTAQFLFLLFLSAAVQTAFSVGKIQVSLRKKAKTKWTNLGEPLEFHNTFVLKKERGECPGQTEHWRRSHHPSRVEEAVWGLEGPLSVLRGCGCRGCRGVSEPGGRVAVLLCCSS